jgi:hypothetical protein
MPDQNIGNITLEEALDFASKRFREYKGEEVLMVVMDLTFVMELLLFLCQKEKTVRCRF